VEGSTLNPPGRRRRRSLEAKATLGQKLRLVGRESWTSDRSRGGATRAWAHTPPGLALTWPQASGAAGYTGTCGPGSGRDRGASFPVSRGFLNSAEVALRRHLLCWVPGHEGIILKIIFHLQNLGIANSAIS
jgi:hypothetical protein